MSEEYKIARIFAIGFILLGLAFIIGYFFGGK